jgi:hypothetical protein
MQKVQGQKPALEETRNRKVSNIQSFLTFIFVNVQTSNGYTKTFCHNQEKQIYAAMTSFHLTDPQVLQGGKVSDLDSGIRAAACFSLQKCIHKPDSGHFSPVR